MRTVPPLLEPRREQSTREGRRSRVSHSGTVAASAGESDADVGSRGEVRRANADADAHGVPHNAENAEGDEDDAGSNSESTPAVASSIWGREGADTMRNHQGNQTRPFRPKVAVVAHNAMREHGGDSLPEAAPAGRRKRQLARDDSTAASPAKAVVGADTDDNASAASHDRDSDGDSGHNHDDDGNANAAAAGNAALAPAAHGRMTHLTSVVSGALAQTSRSRTMVRAPAAPASQPKDSSQLASDTSHDVPGSIRSAAQQPSGSSTARVDSMMTKVSAWRGNAQTDGRTVELGHGNKMGIPVRDLLQALYKHKRDKVCGAARANRRAQLACRARSTRHYSMPPQLRSAGLVGIYLVAFSTA